MEGRIRFITDYSGIDSPDSDPILFVRVPYKGKTESQHAGKYYRCHLRGVTLQRFRNTTAHQSEVTRLILTTEEVDLVHPLRGSNPTQCLLLPPKLLEYMLDYTIDSATEQRMQSVGPGILVYEENEDLDVVMVDDHHYCTPSKG